MVNVRGDLAVCVCVCQPLCLKVPTVRFCNLLPAGEWSRPAELHLTKLSAVP